MFATIILLVHSLIHVMLIGFRASGLPEVRSPAQSKETTLYPDLLTPEYQSLRRRRANANALYKLPTRT